MPIAQIPKQVTSRAQDAVQGLTDWAGSIHVEDRRWMRILGAGVGTQQQPVWRPAPSPIAG